jgi:glycosyltransferase involved in cell wall biosynthesis
MTLDITMPFYGSPEQFRLAVQSVLAQTDPDWRLTVVDDVYPDEEPGRWLQSLGDDRIVYVRNSTNLGVSGNFQKCIDLMTEEHGVIMGCDDLLGERYVARVTELITAFPSASYIQPGVDVIDDEGRPTLPLADRIKRLCRVRGPHPSIHSGEPLAASLMRGNWTYFPSLCWRTETLKRHGFRAEYDVVLDLALQMDILTSGGSLLVDDEVVFSYRRHEASVSSGGAQDGSRFIEERDYFAELRGRFDELGWPRAARAAALHATSRLNAVSRLPGALRARDRAGAAILARHALGR